MFFFKLRCSAYLASFFKLYSAVGIRLIILVMHFFLCLVTLLELGNPDAAALGAELARSRQHLERLGAFLDNADVSGWNEHVVVMKKNELDRIWSKYQMVKDALCSSDVSPDEMAAADGDAIEAANRYGICKVKLDTRAKVLDLFTARPIPRASEIQLPTFSGDYTGWTAWRSEFVNKVKDTNLPVDAKIDILIRSIDRDAKNLIGDPERRDLEEFNRMWTSLENRYDNKYQIILEHISALFKLPMIKISDPNSMRRLLDSMDRELRSLRRFEYDTEHWSPLMAVLLITRMDPTTRTIWEMEHVPNEPPILKNVLAFLEKRLMAVRNLNLSVPETVTHNTNDRASSSNGMFGSSNPNRLQTSRVLKSKHDNRQHPYSNAEQPSAKKRFICPKCDLPHFLWFCRQFKSWQLSERIEHVARWGLCPCCLIAKHPAISCASAGCLRCDNAKHNNMLCPKATVFKLPAAVVVPGREPSGFNRASRNDRN